MNAAVGGSGGPVVLLHGFPQTHLMWRHEVADHTVTCPDLRGYGASAKPAESDPETCSKRTMAGDVVRLAGELGHGRFTLAGHDRGAGVRRRLLRVLPRCLDQGAGRDPRRRPPPLPRRVRGGRALHRRRLPRLGRCGRGPRHRRPGGG
ncbi:alpha/beta fold hydrolase [Streptomyces sp. NPDC001658]